MIKEVINYVQFYFEQTKEVYFETEDVILKSCLVYQYLYIHHFKRYLSIKEILDLSDGDIGLIGPGNGYLTWFFERTIGNIQIIHSHSILHDAFGRFYNRYQLNRGYTYVFNRSFKWMKVSPLCGQISGLIYCAFHRIYIYKLLIYAG